MTLKNVLMYMLRISLAIWAVIMLVILVDYFRERKETMKYRAVIILNSRQYKDTLESLKVETPVYYYDWEETANALGVSVEELTISQYLDHLR